MAENSGISWTDNTFNPWMGCTKVSPACKNCYAERDMDKRHGKVSWGKYGNRVITGDDNWKKPIRWNREAGENGIRYRVFCASLADVFEDWTGPISDSKGNHLRISEDGRVTDCIDWTIPLTMDHVRDRLFRLIDHTPNLDWLLLTKRPENVAGMWRKKKDEPTEEWCNKHLDNAGRNRWFYRNNAWIGTSVESQEYADSRIPELLKCRDLSPVLFLSCEPLLGQLEFSDVSKRSDCIGQLGKPALSGIDWVIAGGESGPDARPSHPDWFRSIRDQCQPVGVPFHFKQWGEFGPIANEVQANNATYHVCDGGERVYRVGKKAAGRLLDGVLHDAFPDVDCDLPY